ncbi:MAG TPA: energy transducer TonB [Thermoanaerobaculia bacterium]|jgi:TonB family protein
MKKALALLLLAAAPVFASDEDVRKGLQNLQKLHELAQLVEGFLLVNQTPAMPQDPWGTPYRLTVTEGRYTIASAGSDKTFDESAWATVEQFSGLEGDVVLSDGKVLRSNRNWLYPQVTDATRSALENLIRAEVHVMMSRNPTMYALERRRATANLMQLLGGELARDAWGTPVRKIGEGHNARIVSAAADKTFDESSWDKPPAADVNEDIVYEHGTVKRVVDERAVLEATKPAAVAIPQPSDPPLALDWPPIEKGTIEAPKVVNRPDPQYPPIYRLARITGTAHIEAAISDRGKVEAARVLKSVAPELDMAALKALRQWTFEPATKDGKPVPVLFRLTINFKLRD